MAARKMPKRECDICHEMIGHYGFKSHQRVCDGDHHRDISKRCSVCGESFENGTLRYRHEKSIHLIYKHVPSAWNKGLDKSDPRVEKYIEVQRQNGKFENCFDHLRNYMESSPEQHSYNSHRGGIKNVGSNKNFRHLKGAYRIDSDGNERWLQSSWEVDLADYLDREDIRWIRPQVGLHYLDPVNKLRRYYPDFYLLDFNLYLDPKNLYVAKKDAYKINAVREYNPGIKIQILSEIDIYFDFNKRIVKDKIILVPIA